jgi:hypothetical protein
VFPPSRRIFAASPRFRASTHSSVSIFLSLLLLCALRACVRAEKKITVHRYSFCKRPPYPYHGLSTMTKAEHSTCVIDHGPHRVRRLESTMAVSYVSVRTRRPSVFHKPSSLQCPTALSPASRSLPVQTTQEVLVQIPPTSTSCVHRTIPQISRLEKLPCSASSPFAEDKIS